LIDVLRGADGWGEGERTGVIAGATFLTEGAEITDKSPVAEMPDGVFAARNTFRQWPPNAQIDHDDALD